MSAIAKTLRAERAKLITDARALLHAEACTPEQMNEADAMIAKADGIMARVERMEKSDALAAELGETLRADADRRGLHVADAEGEKVREQRLFKAYITGNVSALSDDDRRVVAQRINNAASIGTNTAGGFTVAPSFMTELLIAQKAFGGVREAARPMPTGTGVDLPWPTMDDTANVATIVGENTTGVAGTDLVFGSKTLKAWTYRSGFLPISMELLQDSAFDFDTLIRDALALRFARGQNAHFTTGDGTTQPQGIAIGGALGKTGASGQTTSVIYEDFVDLEHSVDPMYRPGARFMMRDTTLAAIKKMKDGEGRPLWLPGLAVGAPDTILGYPITINQDVAAMAVSAKSIFFGNFQNYIIRDVMVMNVKRLEERFAENGQIAFIAFQRTDGRICSAAAPIKWFANSAS